MRIAEFARRLGVSRDTVRRWERRGLIVPSRDWAGHRRFTQADLERVRPLVHGRACRAEVDP
jgi:excisionase family DNA binding protein